VVRHSAICAYLLLRFSQPKRIAREKETAHLIPFHLHHLRSVMADRVTVVPPRDPWPSSTVVAKDLEALVADGLLRPLSGGAQPEWMAPSEAIPSPSPGYVVSFIAFHERGFEVPTSHFMRALLHHYGVELHNLNPNSIMQAAIFAAVCEGFLGIEVHWDLWTHLFSAELFALTTDAKKVRMAVWAGGCTLQLRQARAAVHPYHPCVFEQGVAVPMVLSPERRWEASVVFSASGDRRRQQLALGCHARETGEALAYSAGLAEVTRWGPYRYGGCCRYPSPEGAPFGRAAVAALGDETGGRSRGLADVLGLAPRRRPPQAGSGYGREAGCRRPYLACDAS
jgi:hypothetical protein